MTPADPIDRDQLFLARSGKPHTQAIAHLEASHSLPATADFLLHTLAAGRKDPDTLRILSALSEHRDADPDSPTYGCYKWYVEDPVIQDTNAAFFIGTPLSALWLGFRDRLTANETVAFKAVFAAMLPWFRRMAESPSLFYPNKCLSDAAMLLVSGHILDDAGAVAAGRQFCHRYLDYHFGRGAGWGEDHSPVYLKVLMAMALLILALEKSGALFDQAKRLADAIMEWVVFNDGFDAVPSIRGYNFDCQIRVPYAPACLIDGQTGATPSVLLAVLQQASGYHSQPQPRQTPRQWRRRTFDDEFSTSFIGTCARLGTLSLYPFMPNAYMHDTWGVGWQTKPGAFIVGDEEYGVIEWATEDDEGVVRQHEACGSIHDWPSRHLFKRAGFHPDVVFVGHQEGGAAIILREIHHLHSPTRRIEDRWRLAHARGRILIGGQEWNGAPTEVPPQWLVLHYEQTAVALRPLKCRVLDDPGDDRNTQRHMTGRIVDLPLRIEKGDRGVAISLPLLENHAGMVTQHLFFTGWCVVLLDRPEDVAGLVVTETFYEDGEIPRTYGELIRAVELTTPNVRLKLERDMLSGHVGRFINGKAFRFGGQT
ncbi:MAG: hypothetical protein PHR35_10000 [Kiritimatiellae bacterium]|nr:hypothetical protein [Kiritimatiellia bacterium]